MHSSDQDALSFIKQEIDLLKTESGISMRQIALRAGFKSSNYLQLILSGKRQLNLKSVERIAEGLGLDAQKKQLLVLFHKREKASPKLRISFDDKIKTILGEMQHAHLSDYSLYDAWYHSVIYEMASLVGFSGVAKDIAARLGITDAEAEASLAFLSAKGWLRKDSKTDAFIRKPIHFSGGNKRRTVQMVMMHRRFLEMAIHRLNDDISERSFQALTVAIPWSKFPVVHEAMRKFIDEIELALTTTDPADQIIRIQCCAFKVLK